MSVSSRFKPNHRWVFPPFPYASYFCVFISFRLMCLFLFHSLHFFFLPLSSQTYISFSLSLSPPPPPPSPLLHRNHILTDTQSERERMKLRIAADPATRGVLSRLPIILLVQYKSILILISTTHSMPVWYIQQNFNFHHHKKN